MGDRRVSHYLRPTSTSNTSQTTPPSAHTGPIYASLPSAAATAVAPIFGIGTTSPQNPLSVNGIIQAKEVIVNTDWSDYVFAPDYRNRPLAEVAAYIQENHHLPGIPSAKEVEEKGVSLGDMQAKLLAKVEELTLHMIQAEERNNRLDRQNRELQERIARLETRGPGELK